MIRESYITMSQLYETMHFSNSKLEIPISDFAEMRRPSLSDNSDIGENVRNMIKRECSLFAGYLPKEKTGLKNEAFMKYASCFFIVGNDEEKRNNLAAAILNYLKDIVEYYAKIPGHDSELELNIMHIDARQSMGEKFASDFVLHDGRVQKMMPGAEYPELQKIMYVEKFNYAMKNMHDDSGLNVLMLPDMDKMFLGDIKGHKGLWTDNGRTMLSALESISHNMYDFVIGTSRPIIDLYFGDGKSYAGLDKLVNKRIVVGDMDQRLRNVIESR